MPTRQPFTALCQAAARKPAAGRADLHLHTTFSDGAYSPAQVVDLARRAGLAALALTDHDTLGGIAPAQAVAPSGLEVIPGVEISAEYGGKEFHLLGYFVGLADGPLLSALDRLRDDRAGRFWEMVERLRSAGIVLDEAELPPRTFAGSLGRRQLAELLVKARHARSIQAAFQRYLGDGGRVAVPKTRLPVREAIALVRGAGGVAGWAHPSYDCNKEALLELRDWGLGAVEASYPGFRAARSKELRSLAAEFDLAATGGSDCHGPDQVGRAVGTCSISDDDLARLRRRASA
jgi:predicted metal-dependent phosphoesterase TrpH